METSGRTRGQRLDDKKLTALERLKKARQGEKVDEPEEPEEELYDYIEEEDDEVDDDRYTKKSKSHDSNKSGHHHQSSSSSSASRSKNLARSKVTGSPEENAKPKPDIRDAFFKASTSQKVKMKSNVEPSVSTERAEKLADEIMQELTNKKSKKMSMSSTTPGGVGSKASPLPRPAALPNRQSSNSPYIPFSTSLNSSLLSPSRKRKLDTDVIMSDVNGGASSSSTSQLGEKKEESSCKKISLEPELMQAEFMQQLLDDDSNSATIPSNPIKIKSEPMIQEEDIHHHNPTIPVKTEKIEYDEHDEEAELLSQLSLEASNSSMMHVKQEALMMSSSNNNDATQLQTTASDAELSAQLKSMDTANKILVYWMDTYEDQYSSNGTVYIFGRMPVVVHTTTASESPSLSFVSVCCIVKNIPKVVYVLPRKYRKSSKNDKVPVTLDDVKKEVEQLLEKNRIFSYQIKTVRKYLAFDMPSSTDNIDDQEELATYENECLQVEFQYDPKHMAQLNLACMEGECFSTIFNSNSSHMEHVLIDLKLKGPGWLTIQNAKRRDADTTGLGSMISWCKVEYVIDNYRHISAYHDSCMLDHPSLVLPTSPPLTVLTLLLRTMLNTRTQEHEIVCAIGLVNQKFSLDKATMPSTINKQQTFYDSYFCALTKSSDVIFPFDLAKQLNQMKESNKGMRVELCGSERALLAFLLGKMQSFDVDVIVGHDLFGFNLDILLNRCGVNKVPHWSRMGRLKRAQMPNEHVGKKGSHNQNFNHGTMNLIIQQRIQTVCAGRLLCDVMISAKELLTKCKSFDLNELVSHILFRKDKTSMFKRDLDQEKNIAAYYANSALLIKFLQLAMLDATYILKICNDLQCLQLAYQITCIAGNVLSRTLTGGRSERNEYLLLHAFYDRDFILPEKQTYQSKKRAVAAAAVSKVNKKTASQSIAAGNQTSVVDDEDEMLSMMESDNLTQAMIKTEKMDSDDVVGTGSKTTSNSKQGYAGGLVLEPKIGFYDKFILLLDFNSLYPSIIQEYNICFTTISRPPSELLDRDVEEYIEKFIRLPGQEEKPGILPLEIKKLVDSRRQVKQLMQDKNLATDLKMQYDIRQKALKLTANSLYGCLGFENSRFYCKPLAALITKLGRKLLMKTKELVESKKIDVIYGDTDSIMINTNLTDYDQVIKLGTMLKVEVNKMYRHLEIDIDGVFKCLLLLRKKKYAALTIVSRNPNNPSQFEYQQEIKGLDVVRRDWCILAKQIGERVIGEILSGQNYDLVLSNINKILTETAEKIKNNTYDLSLFEISKQLNRNPEDYSDANHQSHVLVALRHNKDVNNSKKYKNGDVVSYLICEDGSASSATQRAYSRTELIKSPDKLTLDTKYYLTQQIHPIVTRLCEPIDGIDQYHIAESLGLDPSGFRQKSSSNSDAVSIARPTHLTGQQKRLESLMDEMAKFVNSVPFKYICPGCKSEANWQTLFSKQEGVKSESKPSDTQMDEEIEIDIDTSSLVNVKPSTTTGSSSSSSSSGGQQIKCILDSCVNPACKVRPVSKLAYVKNLLTLQTAKYIKQYYQSWLVCDDPLCSFRTKRLSCKFFHGKPQCIECAKYNATLEYSHADLFNQLRFFRFLFDSDAYKSCFKDDSVDINNYLRQNRDIQVALTQLKEHINKKLRENSFGTVDMTSLFRSITMLSSSV